MKTILFLLAAGFALAQVAPRVERDIPYAEPREERRLLDVYAPPDAKNAPVVVWIHGGGWVTGSKAAVDHKPAAFVARGFVFVAMNYRFWPNVAMGDIIRDVAKSVGWTRANIAKYGGDPGRLFLMGHSAGAQLAAILCTDARYLAAERVRLSSIRGCVPVDGDTYDVPLRVAAATAKRLALKQAASKRGHPEKFGPLDLQREYSAVNHIARNAGVPPFLILHVAEDADTSTQAARLWEALDRAGVPARMFGAEGSNHSQLDRDLGLPEDPATRLLWEFVDARR